MSSPKTDHVTGRGGQRHEGHQKRSCLYAVLLELGWTMPLQCELELCGRKNLCQPWLAMTEDSQHIVFCFRTLSTVRILNENISFVNAEKRILFSNGVLCEI